MTVGPTKERQVRHAYFLRGGRLFSLANGAALFTSVRGVVAARVTGGDETVRHVNAVIGQVRNGSRGTEIDVVGVGNHYKRPLEGVVVGVDG